MYYNSETDNGNVLVKTTKHTELGINASTLSSFRTLYLTDDLITNPSQPPRELAASQPDYIKWLAKFLQLYGCAIAEPDQPIRKLRKFYIIFADSEPIFKLPTIDKTYKILARIEKYCPEVKTAYKHYDFTLGGLW